jgi:hypothetical protein
MAHTIVKKIITSHKSLYFPHAFDQRQGDQRKEMFSTAIFRCSSEAPNSRIQPSMASPPRPPGKRTCFPNPLMVFIIIGIIVVAIAAFLVLRPNPSGSTPNSTASPASQQ